MFSKFTLLFLVVIASPLVLADSGSSEIPASELNDGSIDHGKASIFPFIPDFSSLLQNFQGLAGQFHGLGGIGSRNERSAEDDGEEEHQSRFFFSLFPSMVSCNYTTNPGRSCSSCTTTLTCLRNNVGIQSTCRGLFRYCNNGRCSLTQSSSCSGSSASTVAATTVAATTNAPTTVAPTTV